MSCVSEIASFVLVWNHSCLCFVCSGICFWATFSSWFSASICCCVVQCVWWFVASFSSQLHFARHRWFKTYFIASCCRLFTAFSGLLSWCFLSSILSGLFLSLEPFKKRVFVGLLGLRFQALSLARFCHQLFSQAFLITKIHSWTKAHVRQWINEEYYLKKLLWGCSNIIRCLFFCVYFLLS